jgi:ABC-type transport system involved in Fe-S cluster assembly fused permease/ATPase subunit
MTFKITIVSMIIIACFSVMLIVSCKSHEQKTDDAFEQVKEEKKLTNDSNKINNAMVVEKSTVMSDTARKTPDTKKTIPDERTLFKIETTKKIQTNQDRIKQMKAFPNAGINKKVINLEKDNNNLMIKMDEYNKDEKLKWELFKANMNQDVNEIGIELKTIRINNKK